MDEKNADSYEVQFRRNAPSLVVVIGGAILVGAILVALVGSILYRSVMHSDAARELVQNVKKSNDVTTTNPQPVLVEKKDETPAIATDSFGLPTDPSDIAGIVAVASESAKGWQADAWLRSVFFVDEPDSIVTGHEYPVFFGSKNTTKLYRVDLSSSEKVIRSIEQSDILDDTFKPVSLNEIKNLKTDPATAFRTSNDLAQKHIKDLGKYKRSFMLLNMGAPNFPVKGLVYMYLLSDMGSSTSVASILVSATTGKVVASNFEK